ncbi:toxin-antitoxin system YwqK family antitoxin [Ulvibacter litoralis]|uniref:Antitoxin component YwqK of the YwqJK toxin-antitoxin module n=1 Tax=Ulvibacter litoralis TaxID=227084 RepID=A0A1G7EWV2_9FLAO|nr:toxin-antitoxin system YwqK family antitoxin [Ulvibacter litoralis]SDE68153.1 Antitoxin component YwqK of the YwqJK toxin-antitoxin module [Ulvibacter litoralis]
MKTFFLILGTFMLFANCKEATADDTVLTSEKAVTINTTEVLKKELELNQIQGKWYYNGEVFSGYSLRFYPNDTLAERIGYDQGKREGIARKWSENGVLRIESYYKNNRLDSVYKSWWENGQLAAQSNYVNGIKQGTEKEWYATGQLAKQRNLLDGKEDGMQKAWLENGSLYINYEAKNGRIFGMRRANSCYKLEDEKVIRDKKI